MVLLPDATDVQYFLNHDEWGGEESEQLYYEIASEFPSAEAICRIAADLKQAGWRPLQRVDNRTESSFTQGWRVNNDTAAKAHIDLWDAPWTNQSGDHLSYSLTYRYPANGPRDTTSMRVGAYRTPAHLVKIFKMSIGDSIPDIVPPRISPTEIAECAAPRD